MKLTPHFRLREFTRSATADRLGIDNSPTPEHLENIKELAQNLEQVRRLLGHPVIVTSGYRSPDLNKAVRGSATSDHPQGLAADFYCPRFGTVKQVCEAIEKSDVQFDQLIFEQGSGGGDWVHIGFGPRMRRQVLSWKSGVGYVQGIRSL